MTFGKPSPENLQKHYLRKKSQTGKTSYIKNQNILRNGNWAASFLQKQYGYDAYVQSKMILTRGHKGHKVEETIENTNEALDTEKNEAIKRKTIEIHK